MANAEVRLDVGRFPCADATSTDVSMPMTAANLPIVLMYHRIGKPAVDPWELSVSPERFDRQIEILKTERSIVPLHWLAGKLREGVLPRNAVSITFDDGYADVLEKGVPILQKHGAAATMFITTRAVGDQSLFWWDMLARIVLEADSLPAEIDLNVGGRHFRRLIGSTQGAPAGDGSTDRLALHFALHAFLKPMPGSARVEGLDKLAAWAGTDAGTRPCDRVMTAEEVRRFAGMDGLSIGAHTLTHPSLPVLSEQELEREVGQSRGECEKMIGRPVSGSRTPTAITTTRSSAQRQRLGWITP